jgi:hypothetical protein
MIGLSRQSGYHSWRPIATRRITCAAAEMDPLLDRLLAMNCQATIILSLRDKALSPDRRFADTPTRSA